MHRLFASVLLVLAAFGLVMSPAAACQIGMASTAQAVAESPCHEMADALAEPVPASPDGKDCCTSMCAPAMLVAGQVTSEPVLTIHTADAWHPAGLTGLTHPLDKPPPRTDA